MVRREVERLEVVVVGLDLGTFADRVAHRLEDGDDLVHHPQHGVLDADGALDAGKRDVEAVGGEGIFRKGVYDGSNVLVPALPIGYEMLDLRTQCVDYLSDSSL